MLAKLRWIWGVWKPLRGWFIGLLGFTLLHAIVGMAYPLVLREVIDGFGKLLDSQGEAEGRLNSLLGILALLAVGRFVAHYYPALRAYLNSRIEVQLREAAFSDLLRKGEGVFTRFRTGDLVTRLTDDIAEYPNIAWFCCSGIFRALNSAALLIACLAAMFVLDWRLALLSIIPLPLMMGAFVLVKRQLAERVTAQREAMSGTNDLLEASFSRVRIIKASNAEDRQADALAAQLDGRVDVEFGVARLFQLMHGIYNSFGTLGQVVVVAVGGILVIRGEMTAGTLYSFFIYLESLVAPLLDLPNLFVTGRQAFVCIDRVQEVREADPEGEGGALRGSGALERFESLSLVDVRARIPSFAELAGAAAEPPEERWVLEGLSLNLRRGESLAIVGRLGSGKTTLLRVAAGRLPVSAGEVRWNGAPISEYAGPGLLPAIGLVSQQARLFSGTIADNISFGRPLDEAWLADVVEAAGLAEEVAGFPQGLDTKLGQDGLRLSGGQRQRVAIARALYGKPQVLLLDDLTSALDAENEARLWRRLEGRLPDVTRLVVTHRLATARQMDRIAVLDEGRIVASGRHEELLEGCPLYRELAEAGQAREMAA